LILLALVYTFLIALLAGALGAMLGIGGGAILVPSLDYLLDIGLLSGIDFHGIIATSLVCTIATACTSNSVYIKNKITNIRVGIYMGLMNIIGAFTGAMTMIFIPGNTLRLFFGLLLLFTAYNMFRKKGGKSALSMKKPVDDASELNYKYFDEAESREIKYSVKNLVHGVLLSFFGGFIAGLLGVGGGVINVPIMVIVLGIPQKVASATSLFIIGLNGSTGGLIYLISGLINPYLVSSAVVGIFIGALFGTKVLRKLRNETLRKIFSVFLVYFAIRMILKSLQVI